MIAWSAKKFPQPLKINTLFIGWGMGPWDKKTAVGDPLMKTVCNLIL